MDRRVGGGLSNRYDMDIAVVCTDDKFKSRVDVASLVGEFQSAIVFYVTIDRRGKAPRE